MKLFYLTQKTDNVLYFNKAVDAAAAHKTYLAGFEPAARESRKNDVLTEVDCLETLIDLLPEEFQASEDF